MSSRTSIRMSGVIGTMGGVGTGANAGSVQYVSEVDNRTGML